jgi:hypothetical protein
MPLGVHLPGCPCTRCQACAPIVQRVNRGEFEPDARATDIAKDGSLLKLRRTPWDDAGAEDE